MYHLQNSQYFSFCSDLETRSNKHCFQAIMSIWNKWIKKHFTHLRNFTFEWKLFSPSLLLSFVNITVPIIYMFLSRKEVFKMASVTLSDFPQCLPTSSNSAILVTYLHQLHFLMVSYSLQTHCSLREPIALALQFALSFSPFLWISYLIWNKASVFLFTDTWHVISLIGSLGLLPSPGSSIS